MIDFYYVKKCMREKFHKSATLIFGTLEYLTKQDDGWSWETKTCLYSFLANTLTLLQSGGRGVTPSHSLVSTTFENVLLCLQTQDMKYVCPNFCVRLLKQLQFEAPDNHYSKQIANETTQSQYFTFFVASERDSDYFLFPEILFICCQTYTHS